MKGLTSGNPTKILISFAAPIFFGSLFQQLYGMIDMVIVGRTVGLDAVVALGSTTYLSNLIIGFMTGLTNGFAIITARHFGAGDSEKMRRSVSGALILGLSVSALLTLISGIFLESFLTALSTPEEIFDMARDYISVILMCMVTAMLYNMSAGILRAVGDSVTPLVLLIFSSLLNIALDYVLISGAGMGVRGAAYATVISQTVSFILCLLLIIKRFSFIIPKGRDFAVTPSELGELLSMGLSMALMFSIVEMGSLILQSAINGLGTDTIAAHTAARKLSSLLMLPITALSSSTATYCSQNLGAKQYDRISKGIKSALLISWIWSCCAVAIAYTVSGGLIGFITDNQSEEVTALAMRYLKVNTPFYYVLGLVCIVRSAMQGVGQKAVPIISSVIEFFGKIAAVVWLVPLAGYFGVMITEPIVWIFMAIVLLAGSYPKRELLFSIKVGKAQRN
ncbi:MAG: MATE family efflux transporter [Oscillospiraceae bacterium]|nr:MATE family efflux transporter [Oscillospiraceae bacterium]